MSYCRWSSDNCRSDIYCYEAEEGFQIHVKALRVADIDAIPALDLDALHRRDYAAFHATYKAQMDYLKDAPRVPIGLPYDGKSFAEATAGDCLARLLQLREAGYHVPQDAIDALRDEAT